MESVLNYPRKIATFDKYSLCFFQFNTAEVNRPTTRHWGILFSLFKVKKFMMMDAKEFRALEDSKDNAIYFPLMKKTLVVYSEKLVIH